MTWKVSLPCTRREAERLPDELPGLAGIDPPPVLVASEPDEAHPDAWRLDAYFEAQPDAPALHALAALAPSAVVPPTVERLGDEDWVTLSQQGLEPIRAGRFYVHTPAFRGTAPARTIAFEIDAGRAFGTGQHETTAGCLEALDRLRSAGTRVRNIADIGTGTGLLAFAAMRLWPSARAIATDIDPVSIQVSAENAAINAIAVGRGSGRLELAVAGGLRHRRLRARAPFDLVIANILAGPLIQLAPDVGRATAPGGRLILAGLLVSQADAVLAAYGRQGFRRLATIARGDWPTLVLKKRRSARRGEARRRAAIVPAPPDFLR